MMPFVASSSLSTRISARFYSSKTLSLPLYQTKPSATLAINELSQELKERDPSRPLYRFGLGQSPFPVPQVMQESLKQHVSEKDYLPCAGLKPLRASIAEYLNRKHLDNSENSAPFTEDDILIGPGSKELLFAAQLSTYRMLRIPRGSWVSYEPQAQLLQKPVQWIESNFENQFKLQVENFPPLEEEAPHMIILNYPNNPTGATYSEEELQKLAETFRERDSLVIADEIYGEVNHDGKHSSLAKYYPEGTIISSGISKGWGSGGWRLGFFAFPKQLKWLQKSMQVVASETYTSVSAPIQYASIEAFKENSEIEEYLHHSRRILKAVAKYGEKVLSQTGARVVPPEGGFYLLVDLEGTPRIKQEQYRSGKEMTVQLLKETGVAVLPGSDFGFSPDSKAVRLAYVDFDGEKALKAAQSVDDATLQSEAFLKELVGHTIEGLNAFAKWIACE